MQGGGYCNSFLLSCFLVLCEVDGIVQNERGGEYCFCDGTTSSASFFSAMVRL